MRQITSLDSQFLALEGAADLLFRVREMGLAAPGTDEQVARIAWRPLSVRIRSGSCRSSADCRPATSQY